VDESGAVLVGAVARLHRREKELGESFQKEVAKILGYEAETGDCG
jgi:hypothetical protein